MIPKRKTDTMTVYRRKPEETHCELDVTSNGVFCITLNRATRQAVDEGLALFLEARNKHPFEKPMTLLIDLRHDGFPPVTYTFKRFKAFFNRYPMPKGSRAAYILADNTPMVSVAQGLYDVLRLGTNRRFFFGPDAETRAWDFLLDQGTQFGG